MGKKRCRKTYISKGLHSNVSKSTLKLVKADRGGYEKEMNLRKAWMKGLNPWLTVANKEKGTNRPFYKVRANDVWGHPKYARSFNIFDNKKENRA